MGIGDGVGGGQKAEKRRVQAARVAALKAELAPLKRSALHTRATEAGVDGKRLSDALDEDDWREEITKLIVELCAVENDSGSHAAAKWNQVTHYTICPCTSLRDVGDP